MHLSRIALVLATISSTYGALQARVDECAAAVGDAMNDEQPNPSDNSPAGIGAEFESTKFRLRNEDCSKEDTWPSKGKVVAGKTGTNWKLTADTDSNAGALNMEFILDGTSIKVGSGDAQEAGADAAALLRSWTPWADDKQRNNINVDGSKCNPWKISSPYIKTQSADNIDWIPQVTAPMPLDGLYKLMKEQQQFKRFKDHRDDVNLRPTSPKNVLDGEPVGDTFGYNLIVVTQDWFQSSPNGLSRKDMTDDVLGFCSLVLSYAKAAKAHGRLGDNQSPKNILTYMPRTNFNEIFKTQVSSKLTGDLFTIFNTLACYKEVRTKKMFSREWQYTLQLDKDYCTGSKKKPTPKSTFRDLAWTHKGDSVNIKSWIQGIGAGDGTTDALSALDEGIDASLGGFGKTQEKMFGSDYSVPIFEFRDLDTISTSKFGNFMATADRAVQDLHREFPHSSQRKKRQIPAYCYSMYLGASTGASISSPAMTSSSPTISRTAGSHSMSITAAPKPSCVLSNEGPDQGINTWYCLCDSSITLAYSQHCDYKSIPSGSSNHITVRAPTESWTSNCKACTIVGGIADDPTCTTVSGCTPTSAPTPTIAAWVGNLSTINIGDAEDSDGGMALAKELLDKLKAFCSDGTCTNDHAEMDNVDTIIPGVDGLDVIKPAMFFQDVKYSSQDVLEKMLGYGITSWVAALQNPTLNLCKNTTYDVELGISESCSSVGHIGVLDRLRRKLSRDDGSVLWEREDVDKDLDERFVGDPPAKQTCTFEARMCSAPSEITVVMAGTDDPYANYLNLGLTLDPEPDSSFDCESVVEALTAFAEIFFPELLEIERPAELVLEALCGAEIDLTSAADSLLRRAPPAVSRPRQLPKLDSRAHRVKEVLYA
ncbi:hypothetical protein GGR56DRAFT_626001 [Xylariaceae sp. FL0804]|nr:hypothetical protein GGR56DRAFT_626001 [Xylariaceae sp. FL0804]